ncbi:MAG: hypothetical protein DRQ88_02075 [Epsilonproteobacteria bacterium]|nr:MAG: hypothetical protein DRQ89_00820 [Campylobacterota bacterium]RLA67650.1 MAG: hypothetical protein DRQ88_02075 [Campylobacterota bacterium]
MRKLIAFFVISMAKIVGRLFYKIEVNWVSKPDFDPWKNVRMYVFLNHTSLYEPLFIGAIPWRFIFEHYGNVLAPGADITLKRPLVGKFFKFSFPGMMPISRKRDDTWDNFLKYIDDKSMVAIAPEGRMKRPTGLDKTGKPMSIMGGIADILTHIKTGKMILAFSGGLHHVQIPGQTLPKLFKKIRLNYQNVDIAEFIEICEKRPEDTFKKAVQNELKQRMEKYCPPEIKPSL